MSLLAVQNQPSTLYGSGASLGATSIVLTDFNGIDGTPLTMANFGTIGYLTMEPGSSTQEEQVSFSGVTTNANGTVTLTGIHTVLFISPYTSTSGLAKSHAGATRVVVSNTSAFYSTFANKLDDETISGNWTFTNKLAVGAVTSSDVGDAATVQYVNDTAIAGAPNASTTIKGIVQEATAAQFIAATAVGSTGARLFTNPSVVAAQIQSGSWIYAVEDGTGGDDTYTASFTPVLTVIPDGTFLFVKLTIANTGACTFNPNSLGAGAIKKYAAGVLADMETGDIVANMPVLLLKQSSNWIMMNPLGSTSTLAVINAVNAFFTAPVAQGLQTAFTSGESITAGDVVGITSNNTVKRFAPTAIPTTGVDTFTSATLAEDDVPYGVTTTHLVMSNTFHANVTAINDSAGTLVALAHIIPVTQSTGAIGTIIKTPSSYSSITTPTITGAVLVSSTKFMAVASKVNDIEMNVIDTTAAVGTPVVVDTTACDTPSPIFISTSHALCIYKDTSNSNILFAKYTLSGNNLTVATTGTVATLATDTFTFKGAFLLNAATGTILLVVDNTTQATAQCAIATYNTGSSTFSVGSWFSLPSSQRLSTTTTDMAVCAVLSTTQAIIMCPTSTTAGVVLLVTNTAGTLTYGTVQAMATRGASQEYSLTGVNAQCAYSTSMNGTTATIRLWELASGSADIAIRTSTTTTKTAANGTNTVGFGTAAWQLNPTRMGFDSFDGASHDFVTGTGLLTNPLPIGIAQTTVAISTSLNVMTDGYTGNLSGLTAGTQYYPDIGGQLTSDSSGSPPKVLIAKNATFGIVGLSNL